MEHFAESEVRLLSGFPKVSHRKSGKEPETEPRFLYLITRLYFLSCALITRPSFLLEGASSLSSSKEVQRTHELLIQHQGSTVRYYKHRSGKQEFLCSNLSFDVNLWLSFPISKMNMRLLWGTSKSYCLQSTLNMKITLYMLITF